MKISLHGFDKFPDVVKIKFRAMDGIAGRFDDEFFIPKSGDVSVGRGGFQDTVFSLEKYQQTVDNADCRLERSDESIRHHFREPAAQQRFPK